MGHAQELLQCIGRAIRSADTTANEELPKRWVDLIRYLDDKERELDEKGVNPEDTEAQRPSELPPWLGQAVGKE